MTNTAESKLTSILGSMLSSDGPAPKRKKKVGHFASSNGDLYCYTTWRDEAGLYYTYTLSDDIESDRKSWEYIGDAIKHAADSRRAKDEQEEAR